MNKMFVLSTLAILIILWGCLMDEVFPENEPVVVKSAVIDTEVECEASLFSLLSQKNMKIGHIAVSNDENYLSVDFMGNGFSDVELQLWVGTDLSKVPKNNKNTPVPGKFPIKYSGNSTCHIPLSDFITLPPGDTYDGTEVYIFAHAVVVNSKSKGNDEISAWSEGTSFGTSRWGSYSTYIVCSQPQGCFPHSALGGNTFESGFYYYDNTGESGDIQDIHTDNGKVAGTVSYSSGTLSFSFEQEWMFSGTEPLVVIEGCNELGGELVSLSADELSSSLGIYSVPVAAYSFYKIQFNLQICY